MVDVTAQVGVDPSFSPERALANIQALAAEPRPAGSEAYDRAVAFAQGQFEAAGYQVTLQPFPLRTYVDHGATVTLANPDGSVRTIPASTLQLSAGGDVEAAAVAAGLGSVADMQAAGSALRGSVAVMRRGVLRFGEKVAAAQAAGAVGVLVVNDGAGLPQATLGEPSTIPAVVVERDAGETLLAALQAGGEVRVRVQVDATLDVRDSVNVVATRPGTAPGAGNVVIGAHLDGVATGPGANDDGSGSGTVLELARALAQRSAYPFDVTFALFGAEELGLNGSRAYVNALSPAERRGVRAMLNLDMVGVGDTWRFGGTDALVQAALREAAARNLPASRLGGSLLGASDHASFLAANIPAVFLYREDDPRYHQPQDRAEFVDPAALGQAADIVLSLLDAQASAAQPGV